MSEDEFRKKIRWKGISMIFQGALNALNPVMKVGDQIAEVFRLHLGLPKDEGIRSIQCPPGKSLICLST